MSGEPHLALRPIVRRYVGYVEQVTNVGLQLELPHPNYVMVINLGPAIRVFNPASDVKRGFGSFVAGLYNEAVCVLPAGPMRCVQVDLTPIGARLLIRRPMNEMVNQT